MRGWPSSATRRARFGASDDLARIATLGFRGEALPSIASVSHFVLRSRARGAASGTEVRVNGGAVASVMEAGMPEGTSIEVADVFYNLPARRKFLKSDGAESAQVSRIVTQLALCYPEVGFTLTSAGRKVLQFRRWRSLRERLYQLYGDRTDLIEVATRQTGDVSLIGYIAALAEQGPTRGPQNVFINRRIVKDRTIAHAIIDAYSVASIKERSPEVHLFIEMPPDAVDVNVHPTKAEVRFRDQSFIHELVRRALGDALGRGPAPELQLDRASGPASRSRRRCRCRHAYSAVFPSRWTVGASAPTARQPTFAPTSEAGFAPTSEVSVAPTSDSGIAPTHQADDATGAVPRHLHHRGGRRRHRDHRSARRSRARPVRAHHRAADERPTGEPAAARADARRDVACGTSGAGRTRSGARASRVRDRGVRRRYAARLGISGAADDARSATSRCARWPKISRDWIAAIEVEEAIKRIAATMACHAAVKANYPLTHGEDGAHPRRTAAHGVLDDLSARPAGDVAPDPARSREEFPANLSRIHVRDHAL